MKYYSNQKPSSCPKCGAKTIAMILYGMPSYSEKLQSDIDSGKVILRGCCVSDEDPTWQCISCETFIYSSPKQ